MPAFTCKIFRSDRKSTRLNSSHTLISYAVFCLTKKIPIRSEEHTSELQSQSHLVCSLLLETRAVRNGADGDRRRRRALFRRGMPRRRHRVFFKHDRGPGGRTPFP